MQTASPTFVWSHYPRQPVALRIFFIQFIPLMPSFATSIEPAAEGGRHRWIVGQRQSRSRQHGVPHQASLFGGRFCDVRHNGGQSSMQGDFELARESGSEAQARKQKEERRVVC